MSLSCSLLKAKNGLATSICKAHQARHLSSYRRSAYGRISANRNTKIYGATPEGSHGLVSSIISSIKSGHSHIMYGHSPIIAALEAKKRSFKQLYIADRKQSDKKDTKAETIVGMAKEIGIPIKSLPRSEMNNIVPQKPHQGVLLLTTEYPIKVATKLTRFEDYRYCLEILSKEKAHPPQEVVAFETTRKFPVWLALDQIQDEQNLGSILRSALYFGVDGVIVCTKNSAPISHIVAKASSGALEYTNLFSTRILMRFLKESIDEGWDVIGASLQTSRDKPLLEPQNLGDISKPTILVIGNEGKGLRGQVQYWCQKFVTIPEYNNDMPSTIDSLNVGVATGILLSQLCKNSGRT